jgi:GAF domain-containing protein
MTEKGGLDEVPADSSIHLARLLADVATVLLAPGGRSAAVERIVSLAVGTIDSCDEAGLCTRGDLQGLASPTALMVQLDDLQTQLGEGPCNEALTGADSVYVPDLLDDDRWSQFSPEAARLGLRSALAYRLAVSGETLGALQLYAQLPGAFNAHERAQGLIFASYAALALAQARTQESGESRIENLETALASRDVIGQAQGILMERERITADQAFQLLRRSSQNLNRKLRTIAQDLVDTGAIPTDSTEP